MSTTRKLAIGLSLAGGALLAAYLLTGDRKPRTKEFLTKASKKIKEVLEPKVKTTSDDQEIHYV